MDSPGSSYCCSWLPPRPAQPSPDPLHALRRGHMGVVRGDDRRADRAARRRAERRRQRPACRPRPRTSARTCGARWWPSGSGSSATARRSTGSRRTMATLERMERHAPSGQFYNWYDHRTGAKLTTWPPTGDAADADPLVGRQRLAGDRPAGRREPRARAARRGPGAVRLDGLRLLLPARRQPDPLPLRCPTPARRRAATTRSSRESRIASYIGIAKGEIPQRALLRRAGAASPTAATGAGETRPVGFTRTYFGESVFDGAYPYNGTRVTPSWGGSMFEALMPTLFVPEERWGPRQLGRQPPAERARADPPRADRGRLRLLGLLARQHPRGRLRRPTASTPSAWTRTAYPSNKDRTLVDHGFPGCPGRDPQARPAALGLHQRRGHAARRLPRPALGAARDAREPAPARARLPASTPSGASGTRSTSTPATCPTPTSRSTRA